MNPESSNPLAGLRGRDRVRALAQLTDAMSVSERDAYQQAMRMHQASMAFDTESLTEEGRAGAGSAGAFLDGGGTLADRR